MAAKKKTPTKAKTATKSTKTSAAKRTAATSARATATKAGLSLISLAPGLTVNDVETSLSWYRDVLGFQEGERWEMEGKLRGAEMSAGKVSLMLGQDDWKKGRDRIKGQGVRLYCVTGQDIDRLAANIKAKGATVTQEPKDQPWGMRDVALVDPDGYNITIAAQLTKKKR